MRRASESSKTTVLPAASDGRGTVLNKADESAAADPKISFRRFDNSLRFSAESREEFFFADRMVLPQWEIAGNLGFFLSKDHETPIWQANTIAIVVIGMCRHLIFFSEKCK